MGRSSLAAYVVLRMAVAASQRKSRSFPMKCGGSPLKANPLHASIVGKELWKRSPVLSVMFFNRCPRPVVILSCQFTRYEGIKMRSRPIVPAFLGAALLLAGCAGPQWEQRMVSGSNGPVYEIRAGRSSPVPQNPAQQLLAQSGAANTQKQMQEELLKQAALISARSYHDYVVGSEDLLVVSFLDADKLTTEARVNGQGEIRLLLVGNVHVEGLSTSEIASKLATLYKSGGFLVNPQITVSVKEFRHQAVEVTGAVNKPDRYPLIGPRSLLEMLGAAGGLSDKAGQMCHIMRRMGTADREQQTASPETQTIVVDLQALLLKGAVGMNLPVQNGDVIFVPPANTIYVLGAVTKPGGVLLQNNMTVMKAIAQCGGPDPRLASQNVAVLRQNPSGQPETLMANLSQIAKGLQSDVPLQANDIVYLQEGAARRFAYDLRLFIPFTFPIGPAWF